MTAQPDFSALFTASPYPYLLVDTAFIIIGANPAYLKSTGRAADDIVGKHIFDAFPADPSDPESTNLAEVGASIELAISTKKPHTSALLRYAVPRATPEGIVFDARFWSAVHTPVFDADGDVAFVSQNAIDVTDLYRFDTSTQKYYLKQDANAVPDVPRMNGPQLHEAMTRILSAERSALQLLFNQAPGFIAILAGPRHVFDTVNEAYYQLVGHRDILGKPVVEAMTDLAGQGFEALLDQAYRTGEPIVVRESKLSLQRTPGQALEDRYIDLLLQPIVGENGSVTGIFAQGSDVTAAYHARLALSEKIQQLEEVKANQAFQLQLADRIRQAGSLDEVTESACALLGQKLAVSRVLYAEVDDARGTLFVRRDWTASGIASLAGRTQALGTYGPDVGTALRAGQMVVNDDIEDNPAATPYRAAYASIGVRADMLLPSVKSGQLKVVLAIQSVVPRAWTTEELALVQEMARRTWSAMEAAQAQEQLTTADRRKDEFLAMLAHELRNPLAPIGAAAELLQVARLDETRIRQTSQIIDRQVRHMTSLVDDLLDVSRVTRGLVTLHLARVDLGAVANDAVEQVTPLLQARRHTLHLALAPDTPPIEGDPKRLVQVLANLLSNAAKYTPEGGVITLASEVRGAHVLLHVTDNGIGMAPDLVARAFDLFTQAERSSDRSAGGLGLGLALVESMVGLHGGTVHCTSAGLGRGSTFTVSLPRLAPDTTEDAVSTAAPPGRHDGAVRIMIVDDNADAAAMLAMLLEAGGHHVHVEHGARAALAHSASDTYDVFLLDIGLPDIDGNELARRLRLAPASRQAVLVAVTGYGQDQDRAQTAAAGFDHHLVKPVDIARLQAILAGARQA